jgi:hypothetical protein
MSQGQCPKEAIWPVALHFRFLTGVGAANTLGTGDSHMKSPQFRCATFVFIGLCVLLGIPTLCMASNHYVCHGATGAGTGADWNNAYTGFGAGPGQINPGSMVRGDTYYVAAGTVSSLNSTLGFSVPDSGTSVITIQAATDANPGTATGWTSGGTGACHQGQATFGPIQTTTDYWTFNGVYNDLMTAPSNNKSSYGFYFNNGAGTGTPVNSTAAIYVEGTANNVIIKYVDVEGSGNTTSTAIGDKAIWVNSYPVSGGNNDYVGYSHLHDASVYMLQFGGGDSDVAEYNWMERNCCNGGAAHRGAIDLGVNTLSSGSSEAVSNLTIRYNMVEDIDGTSWIDTAEGTIYTFTASNWYIYGNVFQCNTAENTGSNACAGGNGVIEFLGDPNLSPFPTYSNINILNNTVSGLIAANGQCGVGLNSGTYNNLTVRNNIFHSCSSNQPLCGQNGATCTGTTTLDSNSFYNVSGGSGWGTNAQVATGNPFANGGTNAAGANDFQLASDTSAWSVLSNITMGQVTETLTIDLDQNTRTSSRGAYQFQGSSASSPNPPKGLTAVVN